MAGDASRAASRDAGLEAGCMRTASPRASHVTAVTAITAAAGSAGRSVLARCCSPCPSVP
eukprot:scaffold79934_cov21-Phaeocystis_antarctica.AAC.1